MSTTNELVARASVLLRRRKPAAAAALCEQILANDPNDADALYLLGIARGREGDNHGALALFRRAVARRDNVATYHVSLACALKKAGDLEGMAAALQRSIALDPGDNMARVMLAQHLMPGPDYMDVLKKLHDWLQPRSYLEIGVESGRSLALALPPTRGIGVDPFPQIEVAFSAPTALVKARSDDFFAGFDPMRDFGVDVIDLAFIDGLHLFEQTLRDFINVERHGGPRSVILVHDCLPLDEASASRKRPGLFWTGDVWKLIPILKRWRPDLEIRTVAARPSGIAVITQLDPASRVLDENYDSIVAAFMGATPPLTIEQQGHLLARGSNDLAELENYLRSRGFGAAA